MFRPCAWIELVLLVCSTLPLSAQNVASGSVTVPQVIAFSGVLNDGNNKPLTGIVGVTFSLYKEPQGGTPLWMETQNVQLDKTGHYSVVLGSSKSQGLPSELFVTGEARWLEVQAQGRTEQARILLMSVPYALKALDAETIGGKPVSAFMLAPTSSGPDQGSSTPATNITGGGTAGFVPVFTGTTSIGNSKLFQAVGNNIGIGTTTPAAKLDVKGTSDVRDTLTLFPKSTHPTLTIHGTAFAIDQNGQVTFVAGQTFPGTGTVTSVGSGAGLTGGPIITSGTLSIATAGVTNTMLQHSSVTITANSPLTGGGAVSLGGNTSLGLTSSCSSNQILKWNGSTWACSADNNSGGTVTSVGSGLGLAGGPITGSGTLSIDPSVVPELGAENTFTSNNTIIINSQNQDGLDVYNEGAGFGIYVNSLAYGIEAVGGSFPIAGSGGTFEGVFGGSTTDSDFMAGVFGAEDGTTQKTVGVLGNTASFTGAGVYGQNGSNVSSTGSSNGGAGVWGDGGLVNHRIGVLATTDNNAALLAENNTSGFYTLAAINLNTGGYPLTAVNSAGKGCSIDPNGDILCTGSKNALVPVDGGQRKVALAAIESPKNWFEDFGSEQLSNGSSVISLEPEFAQTVNTEVEYHVFLTPKGDCKGLYVSHEGPRSFEVHELGGGTSSVRFDYRIVALRKDYENIRLADHTNDPDPLRQIRETRRTNFDLNKLRPPLRSAQMVRPSALTTRRKK